MTDRPIIFSAPMVQALLDGRKTQARLLATSPLAKAEVGDLLWVREGWSEHHPAGIQEGRASRPGRAGIPGPPGVSYRVIYRTDGDPIRVWNCDGYPYRTIVGPRDDIDARHPDICSEFPIWGSPIFMPRWASRLTLRVEDTRVEPLQSIDRFDALAEGCPAAPSNPRSWYAGLWDELHGQQPNGWACNPLVVALTFEVIRRNVDEVLTNG